MSNSHNCRSSQAEEPFPVSIKKTPLFESTYVNHGFWLLVIFALCGYSLGLALMLHDRQLICEKQIPKAAELLLLFVHQHLLMLETAYFILDFLHLRKVLQQKEDRNKEVSTEINFY